MTYYLSMDYTKKKAPVGWLEALAIGESELANGKMVAAEPIFRRLQESIDHLEKSSAQPQQRRRTVLRR